MTSPRKQPTREDAAAFTATLATKRIAASALFLDASGRVLLVDPVYKDYWDLPGGLVEADESPRAAVIRETAEELGLALTPGRMVAADWVPAQHGRTEAVIIVFDGGTLSPEQIADITLPVQEIRGFAFCDLPEAHRLLSPLLARRVAACIAAVETRTTAYLEDGLPDQNL
jgi:8-oxo-dGTP diphosphatase